MVSTDLYSCPGASWLAETVVAPAVSGGVVGKRLLDKQTLHYRISTALDSTLLQLPHNSVLLYKWDGHCKYKMERDRNVRKGQASNNADVFWIIWKELKRLSRVFIWFHIWVSSRSLINLYTDFSVEIFRRDIKESNIGLQNCPEWYSVDLPEKLVLATGQHLNHIASRSG